MLPRNPKTLLQLLSAKTWAVQREITDHTLDLRSTFRGQASFLPSGLQWRYLERGKLVCNQKSFSATRTYLYEPGGANEISVLFADGRPFYSLDCARLPLLQVRHVCGEDLYEGEIFFGKEVKLWTTEWRVKGPTKNLLIRTEYF